MKVRLLLGQEVQVTLRALQEALAPHAAGAERDLRLDDVVTGAERVAFGMQEGVDPGALIVMQVAVSDLGRERDRSRHEQELPPPHSRGEEHRGADDARDDGGSKVRLFHDQPDRHQHCEDRRNEEERVADPLP